MRIMNILRRENNIQEVKAMDMNIALVKADDMVINCYIDHVRPPFNNINAMMLEVCPLLNFFLLTEALFASTAAFSVKSAIQGFYFSEKHYTLLTQF